MKRTLRAQIEEVEYEIAMRRKVYPGLVARGRIRQAEADEHVLRLECALDTLRWVQKNEAVIKYAMSAK